MKVFTCQDIAHEGEPIQGFCLNLGCQDSRPQFCLQCGFDTKKHSNCKRDLKGFSQIQKYTKFSNIIEQIICISQNKYEEFSKYLEDMKSQLVKISECLSQQDYQQMKGNLQVIKEWYQYLKIQEEILKNNQIGKFYARTQLVRIKMIQTLDLIQGQQQLLKCQKIGSFIQIWQRSDHFVSKIDSNNYINIQTLMKKKFQISCELENQKIRRCQSRGSIKNSDSLGYLRLNNSLIHKQEEEIIEFIRRRTTIRLRRWQQSLAVCHSGLINEKAFDPDSIQLILIQKKRKDEEEEIKKIRRKYQDQQNYKTPIQL